jgi:predicted HicB family RNase H-like nuclease
MSKRDRARTEAEVVADSLRTGRPPKKPAERQTEQVTVRMTPAMRKKLEKQAKDERVPLAELIMRPWTEKGDS